MAASETVCDYVQHNSRPFIFSASILPSACAAASRRSTSCGNIPSCRNVCIAWRLCEAGLKARGLRIIESGDADNTYLYLRDGAHHVSAKRLYDAGVYVNPVLPPAAAPGECLLRMSCMATHTEALLDEAMDIIAEVLGRR